MNADLVLEGGGVKGIGLVGAVSVLEEAGYQFPRVAGTSAGAIVGALVAAREPATRMRQLMSDVDYRRFRDQSLLDRVPLVGKPLSLLFESGVYEGKYLEKWLSGLLAERRVHTFADLRLPEDPHSSLVAEQRYRLVVMAADVSEGRLVRLPWEYRTRFELDPDARPVVEAVRASMSIPFFYKPTRLKTPRGTIVFVDGGVLSNFPVAVFDRTDGRPPRWPTFGVKLSARPDANQVPQDIRGPLGLGRALVKSMANFHDQIHLDEPCVQRRTMFVDTGKINAVDFEISREDQERLYQAGAAAAHKFLANWDWDAYLRECRQGQ